MKKFWAKVANEEKAQTLVVVLLMLVIAAVVAVAISYRTIQDIRQATEESQSDAATVAVESFLEVVTSPGVVDDLIDNCIENGDCKVDENELRDLLDDELDCDKADVLIRPEDEIEDVYVKKDDVFELDFTAVDESGSFIVTWEEAEGSQADHLLIKVYNKTGIYNNQAIALASDSSAAWGYTPGSHPNISYGTDVTVVRIRPIGGNASITIGGLPDDMPIHVTSFKAYCYKKSADVNSEGEGDVYVEEIRKISIKPSVPACFDYVLFDASSPSGVVK